VERAREDSKSFEYLKEKAQKNSRSLSESFIHAWEGLTYIYATQRNMRIHLFIAALAVWMCIALGLDKIEFLMVTLAVLAVLSAEIVNTFAESMVDLMEPKFSQIAKIAKDVAAGGVLLTAVFAVLIGIIAFYPSLSDLGNRLKGLVETRLMYFVVYGLVFVVPSFLGLIAYRPGKSKVPVDKRR